MDHTLALIMKSQQGDKEARDTVFKENAGLVYSMAKRFAGRSVEMEDIVQIGSIGLLKAIDRPFQYRTGSTVFNLCCSHDHR